MSFPESREKAPFEWLSKDPGRKPRLSEIREYKAAMKHDRCAYCPATADVLDHIHAQVRRGGDRWTNFAGICNRCNNKKRDRSLLGFLGVETFRATYERCIETFRAWGAL